MDPIFPLLRAHDLGKKPVTFSLAKGLQLQHIWGHHSIFQKGLWFRGITVSCSILNAALVLLLREFRSSSIAHRSTMTKYQN